VPNRLLNTAVGAKLVTLSQLPRIVGGSEHDDRRQSSAGVAPYAAKHLRSVEPGKLQGQENQARERRTKPMPEVAATEQEVECFLPVAGNLDVVDWLELAQWTKCELDFQWTGFD
jgi:hypothetical protein